MSAAPLMLSIKDESTKSSRRAAMLTGSAAEAGENPELNRTAVRIKTE